MLQVCIFSCTILPHYLQLFNVHLGQPINNVVFYVPSHVTTLTKYAVVDVLKVASVHKGKL